MRKGLYCMQRYLVTNEAIVQEVKNPFVTENVIL